MRINTYFAILDRIGSELKKRQLAYSTVVDRYDFLFKLNQFKPEEIITKAENLQQIYADQFDDNFPLECVHHKSYISSTEPINDWSKSFEFFKKHSLNLTFPNIIDIAMQIFLSMAVVVQQSVLFPF